jgi:O-acetyl-ADP-ribose deacetylase (regulator of RNase III)
MIEIIEDKSIFESSCEALVNPVNCEGVAGKGLALEFKKKYPVNFNQYVLNCQTGFLIPGRVLPVKEDKWIFNFPTKNKWREDSKYNYIYTGLIFLNNLLIQKNIKSVAIPALGCGLGGLEWTQVKDMIYQQLKDYNGLIELYPPK